MIRKFKTTKKYGVSDNCLVNGIYIVGVENSTYDKDKIIQKEKDSLKGKLGDSKIIKNG